MRKLFILLTLTPFFALFAQSSTAFNYPMNQHQMVFEASANLSHTRYDEEIADGVHFMDEYGWLFGPAFALSYLTPYHIIGKLQLRGLFGSLNYESKNSGEASGIRDHLIETRALVGYQLRTNTPHPITPYTGFGYRFLEDDGAGATTSKHAGMYDRQSNYYYSPIGFMVRATTYNKWYIDITAEYDHLWHGLQKSDMSAWMGEVIKNKQSSGHAIRASLRLSRNYKDNSALLIEPFFTYWSIGRSDTVHAMQGDIPKIVTEPENTTIEIGLRLSYALGR